MVRLSSLYYLYSCLNGKIVAAKECLYEKQEQFNDMKSELKIMTRLNAASVIQVYGYSLFNEKKNELYYEDGEDEYNHYFIMIMEKADTSLDKVLKEPCSIEKKKMYILQIAHGLWILRFNGLCHGNLKLDNVLMVDGNCKLADFELSHFVPTNEMEAKQKFTFGNLLQYVLVLSIKFSRAPELYRLEFGEKIDLAVLQQMLLKADVYALGMLISEILSGQTETCAWLNGESNEVISSSVWNVL